MTELIPGKRYRYTYAAEGVARSDKSGIDLDEGGAVEAEDFSVLLERGYLELLPDPLPTTPGSVVMHDGKVYARADQVARGHWFCVSAAYGWFDDAALAGATVLFDAGAERA